MAHLGKFRLYVPSLPKFQYLAIWLSLLIHQLLPKLPLDWNNLQVFTRININGSSQKANYDILKPIKLYHVLLQ